MQFDLSMLFNEENFKNVKSVAVMDPDDLATDSETREAEDSVAEENAWGEDGEDEGENEEEERGPRPAFETENSWVILDKKVAVIGAVHDWSADAWLERLDAALEGRTPDYLVLHRVDRSYLYSVVQFMEKYPRSKVVASAKAFRFLKAINEDFVRGDWNRKMIAEEDLSLNLGAHRLRFIGASMASTPDAIMCYEEKEHILFSGKMFGNRVNFNELFAAEEVEIPTENEYKAYYQVNLSKYYKNVWKVLKKVEELDKEEDLAVICPDSGFSIPFDQIRKAFEVYEKAWRESDSVSEDEPNSVDFARLYMTVVVSSSYHYVEAAANQLIAEVKYARWAKYVLRRSREEYPDLELNDGVCAFLEEKKDESDAVLEFLNDVIKVFDLDTADVFDALYSAVRTRSLVLGADSLTDGIPDNMRNFLTLLKDWTGDPSIQGAPKDRYVTLIESGSFLPCAAKCMLRRLDPETTNLVDVITVTEDLTLEKKTELRRTAAEIIDGFLGVELNSKKERIIQAAYAAKVHVCDYCRYEYNPVEGDPESRVAPGTAYEDLPEDWVCPICGEGKDTFYEKELNPPETLPWFLGKGQRAGLAELMEKAKEESEKEEASAEFDADEEGDDDSNESVSAVDITLGVMNYFFPLKDEDDEDSEDEDDDSDDEGDDE